MTSKPTERFQAAAQGSKRYFTGEPCKRGHVADRFTSNGGCTECVNLKVISLREERPNTAMPVGPLVFPIGVQVTPEMVRFTYARQLARVPADVALYDAVRGSVNMPVNAPLSSVATEIYNRATALRDAHVRGLIAKGWTQAMIDEACRYA